METGLGMKEWTNIDMKKIKDGQTDGWTDRQTDNHTDNVWYTIKFD